MFQPRCTERGLCPDLHARCRYVTSINSAQKRKTFKCSGSAMAAQSAEDLGDYDDTWEPSQWLKEHAGAAARASMTADKERENKPADKRVINLVTAENQVLDLCWRKHNHVCKLDTQSRFFIHNCECTNSRPWISNHPLKTTSSSS